MAAQLKRDFWKGKHVLLTGYGGFVGSWLGQALMDLGANVTVITRDVHEYRRNHEHNPSNSVIGDVTDYFLVQRVMTQYQIEYCFHLAAQAIVISANSSPIPTFESNISGTWNILECCRLSKFIKGVVVASSDKSYGEPKSLPLTEDHPLEGSYPYDASKACADILSRSYSRMYGMNLAVTRCANIYGGGDMNFSRIVPSTILSMLRRERPVLRSSGRSLRDYVYIKDVINAYLVLAENIEKPGIKGEAFNFGTKRPLSVLEMVEKIRELCGGADLAPIINSTATGEITNQYLSSEKAFDRLGWVAETPVEQGLSETIDWYRNWLSRSG